MILGLLASTADAAPLLRLLRDDLPVRWRASSLDDAIAQARALPVDALLASTDALRGSTGRIACMEFPVILFRSGHATDDAVAYEAMSAGAAYTLTLPRELSEERRQQAFRALRLAASARAPRASAVPPEESRPPPGTPCPIVAVGASTGGPPALADLLQSLGKIPAAILIVQHIDPSFTQDMAGWLSARSGTPVDLSTGPLAPRPGRAILAASSEHLIAAPGGHLRHAPAAPGEIHHPSVNALFLSLASHAAPGVAVLLTGMGRDGAEGLLALRRAGWTTLAQDAATSAVYGMPKAARELNAAQEILPLDRIGPRIRQRLGVSS